MSGDGMAGGGDRTSRPVRQIQLKVSRCSDESQSSTDATVDLSIQLAVEERDLQPVKVGYILENETQRKRLPDPFANMVVVIEDGTVEFILDNPELDTGALEGIGNTLVDALLALACEVKCTTHTFAGEKYTVALSHFAHYCRKLKSIRYYKEGNSELMFAYMSDDDENFVRQQVEIISDQQVVEAEIPLDAAQVCVIQGTDMDLSSICPASTAIQDYKIQIFGIQEDVATSKLKLHTMLATMVIKSDTLEPFTMKLIERDPIKKVINELLQKRNLQWCIKERTFYVAGKKATRVESGVSAVKEFFRKIPMNVSRLERSSRGWDRFVKLVTVQFGCDIDIDDSGENKVVIGVTATQYSAVVQYIQANKSKWTLTNKRVPLPADTCAFVGRLANDQIRHERPEFLEVRQASDGRTIELVGTEDEVKAASDTIQRITQRIAQANYGVPHPRAATFLKECGEDFVTAKIKLYKIQKQIIVKEGKIEDENVDVIVNSTAYSLNLKQADSAMTTAIYAKAGQKAQESILGKTEQLVRDHMVVGGPGNLGCKQLYHVALDAYEPSKEQQCRQTLEKVVGECLRIAGQARHKTVSFPAICTGMLKYPCTMVADTMLGKMVQFFNSEKQGTIQTIYIVILRDDKGDKGESKKRIFENELARRRQEAEKVSDCLVQMSSWVFDSDCELILESTESVEPTLRALNENYTKQTLKREVE